jgi:hypothetical protein
VKVRHLKQDGARNPLTFILSLLQERRGESIAQVFTNENYF